MKLPIIRQLYQNCTEEQLDATLEVLEKFTEFRGVSDEDLDVAGEIITHICGAQEVQAQVKAGASEKDALNGFAQKVMGSIDR